MFIYSHLFQLSINEGTVDYTLKNYYYPNISDDERQDNTLLKNKKNSSLKRANNSIEHFFEEPKKKEGSSQNVGWSIESESVICVNYICDTVLSLNTDEILLLPKSLILNKFHNYIRL